MQRGLEHNGFGRPMLFGKLGLERLVGFGGGGCSTGLVEMVVCADSAVIGLGALLGRRVWRVQNGLGRSQGFVPLSLIGKVACFAQELIGLGLEDASPGG